MRAHAPTLTSHKLPIVHSLSLSFSPHFHTRPPFRVAEHYAVVLNSVCITLIFSVAIPLVLPVGCLSFALLYWSHKWGFIRLYRRPPVLDQTLASVSASLLLGAAAVHLAFTLWLLSGPALADHSSSSSSSNADASPGDPNSQC